MKFVACCFALTLASASLHAQVTLPPPVLAASHASRVVVPAAKNVARVNGAVLTDRDVLREMMNIFPYAKQHGGHFPKDSEAVIRKDALRNVEFEELVYQEALRRKLAVSPAKLDQAMRMFRKQFDSQAEYQAYLKQEHGGSTANLRAKVNRAVLIDQFLNVEIRQKSRLSDAALREFYSKNPERFRKPESVSIQTISIVVPEGADRAKARARAEEALRQAKATKSYEEFGMLAEKVSEDDWHVMMGDHKWLHRGRMPGAVEQVAYSMKPGTVSDLIDTGDSLCIVRLNDRQDAKLVPFSEIRAEAKKGLEEQKMQELRKSLEARLRKGAKIEEL